MGKCLRWMTARRPARDPRPEDRDGFRRVLIHDQAARDTISRRLMCYCDQNGQDWADVSTS
jgi:hypothetical protein